MQDFNILKVIKEVQELRDGFTLESDFQFIVGLAIKNIYKNAKVLMEYRYPGKRQNIDILVIMNNRCYPIELKYYYKYNEDWMIIDKDIKYSLKDLHTNTDQCITAYRKNYYNDIKRLIKLCKDNKKINNYKIDKGYAIMLTNFEKFQNKRFSDYVLTGKENIKLKNSEYNINKDYEMKWYDYNDRKNNGFIYLITTIPTTKN